MKTLKIISVILLTSIVIAKGQAQKRDGYEAAVLFGLSQPLLLRGFNVEGNFFTRKMAFDYSHGISLEYEGNVLTNEMKEQHLVAHLPYSTGFGIGYRFAPWINLRVEPKWHRYEIYYEDEERAIGNQITTYNTFTLGLGLYGKWHPFKKQNFLKRNYDCAQHSMVAYSFINTKQRWVRLL